MATPNKTSRNYCDRTGTNEYPKGVINVNSPLLLGQHSMVSQETSWPTVQWLISKGFKPAEKLDVGSAWSKSGVQWSNLSHYNLTHPSVDPYFARAASGITLIPCGLEEGVAAMLRAAGVPSLPDYIGQQSYFASTLVPYGTQGISLGIPFDSVAELGTALGELLVGGVGELPTIPLKTLRQSLRLPRKTRLSAALKRVDPGSEYLNVVFAWNPTIGDLQDSLFAVKNANKLVAAFLDRFGKRYRFRRTLKDESRTFVVTDSKVHPVYGGYPPGTLSGNTVPNPITFSGQVTQKIWVSGAFQYYLDQEQSMSWVRELDQKVSIVDYLLGLRPDVEMIWELVPFSWLADWWSSAGAFFKNVSYIGRDGLVLHHAYAMMSFDVSARAVSSTIYSPLSRLGFVSGDLTSHAKMRIRATPYGFGITPDSFSSKQWAILAALGATLVHGKLP